MAAEHEAQSTGEYIRHHLTFLANKEQTAIIDFSVDQLGQRVLVGVPRRRVRRQLLARRAPGHRRACRAGFLAFIEIVVRIHRQPVGDMLPRHKQASSRRWR